MPFTPNYPNWTPLAAAAAALLKRRFCTLLNENCHCAKRKMACSMLKKFYVDHCTNTIMFFNSGPKNHVASLIRVFGVCISCPNLYLNSKVKLT